MSRLKSGPPKTSRENRIRMDESLIGAVPMAILGVGTVFFALLTIIGVVSLNGYLAERGNRTAAAAAEGAPQAEPAVSLRSVALAAYALHLRSRALAITRPAQPSRWAMAGRVQQTSSFQR